MRNPMLLIAFIGILVFSSCQETEYHEIERKVEINESKGASPESRRMASPSSASKYISRVFRFRPAPGQFTNVLPAYVPGDNAAAMAAKAGTALIGKTNGLVCLGAFGGSIIVGFDHTIANVSNAKDFKIYGNAFTNWAEAGIVMVSKDVNGDGFPNDPWYELAGSEYNNPNTIKNYRVTYFKPSPLNGDVHWSDNQGKYGKVKRNTYHTQASYYPLWMGQGITFKGTKIPGNVYDANPDPNIETWKAPAYPWGYADNVPNNDPDALFDIDWAVNASGNPVNLTGIDFIKVYTATLQDAGWLGEVSTEIAGIEDINL